MVWIYKRQIATFIFTITDLPEVLLCTELLKTQRDVVIAAVSAHENLHNVIKMLDLINVEGPLSYGPIIIHYTTEINLSSSRITWLHNCQLSVHIHKMKWPK